MKRIKKYIKPKEKKTAKPENRAVWLPSRFEQGIQKLFDVSANLKETEADLLAGPDGSIYFFHARDLKKLYEQYRDGEIDIAYLRKWFKLFLMVREHIVSLRGYAYAKTMSELLKLAGNNQLTRKNFLALSQELFLRVEPKELIYFDAETGTMGKVKYDSPAKVLPLVPKRK